MSRPHVLLITVDHWPAGWLGCAGHSTVQTPTLDRLAECGVRFTNAYSECPVCIPARRTLMTGLPPRGHGDRTFQTTRPMPDVPTLAESFRQAGYQTVAVGKLHVFPQRSRIGFDDVLLAEEGRPQWGVIDDYDLFLGERGFVGRQFDHGMGNNDYVARPWHLAEELHVTNWITREMARMIRRRDPTRPGFWYLSYTHPHPPLVPPQVYWDCYRDVEPEWPRYGHWVPGDWRVPRDPDTGHVRQRVWRLEHQVDACRTPHAVRQALRAFSALCTHIDHQLRLVIGTLREEGLLNDTILLFTADHGDMLGTHGLWAKRLFYEGSANIPLIVVPHQAASASVFSPGGTDDRLAGLQDVMPTLLDLAGLPIPETCHGRSLTHSAPRAHLYGECNEGGMATRMIHDGRHKLIYYPVGNVMQLFELDSDPHELHDRADDPAYAPHRARLTEFLLGELYGSDCDWLDPTGRLVGLPDPPPGESHGVVPGGGRGLALQRGTHWPPPPVIPLRPGESQPGTS
jgi:arylsulfatase A-like enzyme